MIIYKLIVTLFLLIILQNSGRMLHPGRFSNKAFFLFPPKLLRLSYLGVPKNTFYAVHKCCSCPVYFLFTHLFYCYSSL